ncbi:hypothetical protein RSOL_322300 [Rhizoctonia solani AG-3 Rhs1AP]|uniref:RING-type domain-containing protein n=2 Tax=Rhizoctonia solani AG-3 TaxID=1086053 RepID=A0A074S731_9AGAM|nr:hypothetical protein RSOL_322300 [Rhizoctonia solani AG-3 Rhs1AP]KEP55221.1 hypothetical protein V565_007280 [Rhizoctonia solani 123E]
MPLPSTPPLSSPSSPTTPRNPRNGSLRTPLRPSRGKRSSAAPPTPQSLVPLRTSLNLRYNSVESAPHSLSRKPPSTRDPNWRIREESVSSDDTRSDTHPDPPTEEQPLPPTTPNKLAGPFTPQAIKSSRSPLRLDTFNIALFSDPIVRGSFTDPPPRRRETRPSLNDETRLDVDQTLTVQEHMDSLGSPMSIISSSPKGTKCASCGGVERLSLLEPCQHQICAPCVTGSLNVVGEKDMICMYCLSPIKSFKIARGHARIHSEISSQGFSSPDDSRQVIHPQDSPTPQGAYHLALSRPDPQLSLTLTTESPIVVLRIDNVPWDVTPPMIEKWLGNPTLICHVLLDREDGRTLNHAFVETRVDYARSALRTHQNKVLGCGRRARAVTITLSNQQDLMHALFPSWPGRFEGALPVYDASPTDPQPPQSADLLTDAELRVILHLIQSPKSHFLKVPALAYWSLLSLLVKTPAPDVFAPGTVPDTLFDIAAFALEKYELQVGTWHYDSVLHMKLIEGALNCRAFTDRQLSLLFRFTNQHPPSMHMNQLSKFGTPMHSSTGKNQPLLVHPLPNTPWRSNEGTGMDPGPLVTLEACNRVAQDFGLDSILVHALAERLVFHSSTGLLPFGHH